MPLPRSSPTPRSRRPVRTGAALLAAAAALAACRRSEPLPPELAAAVSAARTSHPGTVGRRILLLALDGCDPDFLEELIRQGKAPHFARIWREGTRAFPVSPPPIEPGTVWTTAATGVAAQEHGILGTVARLQDGSLHAAGPRRVRVPTVWELVSSAGWDAGVIGWPLTSPERPTPGPGFVLGASWDPVSTTAPPLVETRSDRRGDGAGTDLAHLLADARSATPGPDAAQLRTFLHPSDDAVLVDPAPGTPARTIGDAVHRAGIVRDAALRIWRERGPRLLAVHLDLIDALSGRFMREAAPRLPEVAVEGFTQHRDVMASAYAWCDRLVGEAMDACGPGELLVIVSARGVRSGVARPLMTPDRPEPPARAWHRPHGILCLFGGGAAPGVEIPQVRADDLAPTLLAALGLPAPEHMSGRVLHEAFAEGLPVARVPAYPARTAPTESPAPAPIASADERARAFIDLGDAELARGDLEAALQAFDLALESAAGPAAHSARAHVLRLLGRSDEALRAARDAVMAAPDDASAARVLAEVLLERGDLKGAAAAAQVAETQEPRHYRTRIVAGQLAWARSDAAGAAGDLPGQIRNLHLAVAQFDEAARIEPRSVEVHIAAARLRLTLQGEDAEEEARHALEDLGRALRLRPTDLDALDLRTTALLRVAVRALKADRVPEGREFLDRALASADEALAVGGKSPVGWANRAYVLWTMERRDEAVEAARTALSIDPGYGFNRAFEVAVRMGGFELRPSAGEEPDGE